MKIQIFLVCLFSTALALPKELCTDDTCPPSRPATLNYVVRKNIGASFSLQCGVGAAKNEFEITVRPIDSNLRSTTGWMKVLGKGGKNSTTKDPGGSLTPIVHRGKLSDLTLQPGSDGDCQENWGVKGSCRAKYSGSVELRQYVQVPGSVSPLFWPGFYDIDITCRILPIKPAGQILINDWVNTTITIEHCLNFTQSLIISPVVGPVPSPCPNCYWPSGNKNSASDSYNVIIGAEFSQLPISHDWMLTNCRLAPINSPADSPITFIKEGFILDLPEVSVTGSRFGSPTSYQLTLQHVAVPFPDAALQCDIRLCSKIESTVVPICPELGEMPRRAAMRGISGAVRAHMKSYVTPILSEASLKQTFGNANLACS